LLHPTKEQVQRYSYCRIHSSRNPTSLLAQRRYPRADISTTSLDLLIGPLVPPTLSKINNEMTILAMGCTDNATVEEQKMQTEGEMPEGRNKSARKSDDITMMPARAQRNIMSTPNTGEQEQSAPKKTRSTRKKDLLAFFGEGARVQPPSTDDTPIDAAKMRRSTESVTSGPRKRRDKTNSSNAIGRKKSKSDDEESQEEVANLEKMAKTPLKPKGSKPKPKKGLSKKNKATKTPDSGRKKATFAETVGKEVVKEIEIEYK
jgi:hypothetical protein